jgi:hypothetical protein
VNTEAFREALLKDGFTVVERSVAPNSTLEEHDHAWEVKAMITAGIVLRPYRSSAEDLR